MFCFFVFLALLQWARLDWIRTSSMIRRYENPVVCYQVVGNDFIVSPAAYALLRRDLSLVPDVYNGFNVFGSVNIYISRHLGRG